MEKGLDTIVGEKGVKLSGGFNWSNFFLYAKFWDPLPPILANTIIVLFILKYGYAVKTSAASELISEPLGSSKYKPLIGTKLTTG